MIKFLLVAVIATTSTVVFAQSTHDYNSQVSEYDEKPVVENSLADIHARVNQDMELACEGSLCTAVIKNSHQRGWTLTFDVGEGSPNYGQGTVIITDGNAMNQTPQPYWGARATYENIRCTSTVEIDKSIYRSLKVYLESLVNEDGSTKRTLYPSETAMILLYTTIMNEAESCRPNSGAGAR